MRTTDHLDATGTPGAASDTADRAGAITHPKGAKVTGATVQDEGRPTASRLTSAQLAALVRQDLDHAISDGTVQIPPGVRVTVHTEYAAVIRDGKHRAVLSLAFILRGAIEPWGYLDPPGTEEPEHPSHEARDLAVALIELASRRRQASTHFRHFVRLDHGPIITAT